MADHGATAHATEKPGDRVGRALGDAFLAGTAALVGDFTYEVQGQKAFDQTDRSQNDCIGQNDFKGFKCERDHGDVQAGQATLDRGQIANTGHV